MDGVLDLLGHNLQGLCGSCVFRINQVGFQYFQVIPRKLVGLWEGEIETVSANQRQQNGWFSVAVHGEGLGRVSKSSYPMIF